MTIEQLSRKRTYQRTWLRSRRASYLAGKRCALCGSRGPLELHHADPGAKVSHRIWSWRPERRDAELSKCVVLCARCHRRITAEQQRREWRHGTVVGYRRGGCRCEACRAAEAGYKARRKRTFQLEMSL